MKLIDSHIHLWDPINTPREISGFLKLLGSNPKRVDKVANWVFPKAVKEFFGSSRYLSRPYLIEDYIEDRGAFDVEGIVHIEAGWKGKGELAPVDETRWLEGLNATSGKKIKAIIVNASFEHGKQVEPLLKAHLEASNLVRGVRESLTWHPSKRILKACQDPNRMKDLEWLKGFETLAKFDLSFEATVYDNQLDDLNELAKGQSHIKIMLSHLGTPIAAGGEFGGLNKAQTVKIFGSWKDHMERLAQNENVHVKLSGLAMPILGFGWHLNDTPPSAEQVAEAFSPFVDHAIEIFGPDRCLFGSNYPIDKVSVPLSTLIQAFELMLSSKEDGLKEKVFYQNAMNAYKIETE